LKFDTNSWRFTVLPKNPPHSILEFFNRIGRQQSVGLDLIKFPPTGSNRPFAAIRKGSIDSHPKASFDCSHKAIRITHFQNQSREVHGVPAQRGAYGHAAASPTDGH